MPNVASPLKHPRLSRLGANDAEVNATSLDVVGSC